MTKRTVILAAAIVGALASPFTAIANEPSHNVGGERGIVFHDARSDALSMARSDAADSGWRYVGGEAAWIYEGSRNRSTRERSDATGVPSVTRASERAPMQQAQINGIYHGA